MCIPHLKSANDRWKRRPMILPLDKSRWPAEWRELYEERAGIIEFMSNLSRESAEFRAEYDIREIAKAERGK
jgi:hypothetical protein